MASVNDGVVGDFYVIADDAGSEFLDGSTLYYSSNINYYYIDDGDPFRYGDLYSCNSGNSTLLVNDILVPNGADLYSDGVILAYTDGYRVYTEDYGYVPRYELSMIDSDGETTIIGDNVSQYIRVDESTLLYISDGDLYSYNGTESKKLKSDVDGIWSKNSAEFYNAYTM